MGYYLREVERLMLSEKVLKQGVKCPYCGAESLDVGRTTQTLLYSDWLPIFNPNTFTTEYNCRNCEKRFWISRKGGLEEGKLYVIEEYVFEEGGKTKRIRKKGAILLS